jgi:hypothetical protein
LVINSLTSTNIMLLCTRTDSTGVLVSSFFTRGPSSIHSATA